MLRSDLPVLMYKHALWRSVLNKDRETKEYGDYNCRSERVIIITCFLFENENMKTRCTIRTRKGALEMRLYINHVHVPVVPESRVHTDTF